MITSKAATVVHRPIAEVYEFLADATNDPLWCPPVESVKQISSHDGATRYEAVAKPGPKRVTNRFELRTVDHPHRIEWNGSNETATFHGHYELTEVDGDTRVSMVSNLEPGWPMKLLTPVISAMSRSNARTQFEQLKAGLESQQWAGRN